MSFSPEQVFSRLDAGLVLSEDEAAGIMSAIADGRMDTPQIVRFLLVYNRRCVTAVELGAFVSTLRGRMMRVHAPRANTICNCGTGGDGRGTFNVSTAAAFVIAACDIPVAKHGNRSVSSNSGSTDCVAAMGVGVCRTPAEAESLLAEHGLCFMNAPDFHPALRHAAEARRELARTGQKSIFNLLGPMLNPALVKHQSMGIFAPDMLRTVAEVLAACGTRQGYVAHGDGYDELTLTGPTNLCRIADGQLQRLTITPEEFGLTRCAPEELRGGDAWANARLAEDILTGRCTGPKRDMVLLNAAAGISAGSLEPCDLQEGLKRAREAIDDGRANAKLMALRKAAPNHA